MGLDVLGEMVASHESFAAFRAPEPLFAGVRSQMALKFVRARKRFAAKEPIADEGPLAAVPSQVRLQVRRLPVDLAASRHVADVLLLLGSGFARRRILAIRAPAAPAASLRGSRCGGPSGRRFHVSRGGGGCGSGGMEETSERSVRWWVGVRIGGRRKGMMMRIESVFE